MKEKPVQNLQDLYKEEYVERFEREQSSYRIGRLLQYIDLPNDADIADFGCGNGMLLPCLSDRVKRYSGVDFSGQFILAARNRQKMQGIANADFFCESIESFCSRNRERFDAGFVLDLAEHIPDKEWSAILTAIHRSLRPGGKLYLHTPNAMFFLEIMKRYDVILHQLEEHVAVRGVQENVRMLKEAGFSITGIRLLPHYNILQFIHVVSFLPVIGKYFKARIFITAEKEI